MQGSKVKKARLHNYALQALTYEPTNFMPLFYR